MAILPWFLSRIPPGVFVHVLLHLEAGWNCVVVKVINNRGNWFLRFLVAVPSGNLLFSNTRSAL